MQSVTGVDRKSGFPLMQPAMQAWITSRRRKRMRLEMPATRRGCGGEGRRSMAPTPPLPGAATILQAQGDAPFDSSLHLQRSRKVSTSAPRFELHDWRTLDWARPSNSSWYTA
ncbi:hypothetical protein ACQKWADRAFT_301025 [Trichoderma austrokoningii]